MVNHPEKLNIKLEDIPFQCDWTMCWIKQGKKDGWLQYYSTSEPECVNYPDESWDEIDLDCDVADELEKASKTQLLLAEIIQQFLQVSTREQ